MRFLTSISFSLVASFMLLHADAKQNHGVLESMDINGGGFYYYDDGSDDNISDTQSKKKIPVKPENMAPMMQMERMIEAMERNNELQEKILAKLDYAFPRTTPEWTTNSKTGEKCKANSSAECFVMPVIAEAQQSVPAMVEMLREPSVKNVKNYLEWQAVYMNQAFQVGRGFQMVSLQYERDVNKLDGTYHTQLPTMGNMQNDVDQMQRSAVIMRLKKKLGVLVFIGKTDAIERNFNGMEYTNYLHTVLPLLDNFSLIFNSPESLEKVDSKIRRYSGAKDTIKKWDQAPKRIDPALFEKYKISVSPASVLFYKKDNGEVIWQKLGYATLSPKQTIDKIYNFLKFHKIIKPGAINEKDAYQIADQLRLNGKVEQSLIDSIDINETGINVEDDQIIIKGK
jgi:hypothetical protein